jgi:hypothetical protein
MTIVYICENCGGVIEYLDSPENVEEPDGLCKRCDTQATAFDEGFAEYEARVTDDA